MNKRNVVPAIGTFLALAVALLWTGHVSAGDDEAKAEKVPASGGI